MDNLIKEKSIQVIVTKQVHEHLKACLEVIYNYRKYVMYNPYMTSIIDEHIGLTELRIILARAIIRKNQEDIESIVSS